MRHMELQVNKSPPAEQPTIDVACLLGFRPIMRKVPKRE